jgi:hypothetical protein
MDFIFNKVWIFLIIVSTANGFYWKYKSKKYIAENPELEQGYNNLIKGWFIFTNIPWLIIGIGLMTGLADSFFDFLNPRQLKPIVILFFLSILVLWIIGTIWLFLKKGAEKIVLHPGLFTPQTEKGNEKFEIMKIKLLWIVGIVGSAFGLYMMWEMNM